MSMTDFSTLFCGGVYTRMEAWIVMLVTNFAMFVVTLLMILIFRSEYSLVIIYEVYLFCILVLREIILFKRLKDITGSNFLICILLVAGILFYLITLIGKAQLFGLFSVIILCIPSAWVNSKYVQKDLENTSLEINQLIQEESYKKARKKANHIINIYSSHYGGNNAKEVVELKNIFNIKFNNKVHFYIPGTFPDTAKRSRP